MELQQEMIIYLSNENLSLAEELFDSYREAVTGSSAATTTSASRGSLTPSTYQTVSEGSTYYQAPSDLLSGGVRRGSFGQSSSIPTRSGTSSGGVHARVDVHHPGLLNNQFQGVNNGRIAAPISVQHTGFLYPTSSQTSNGSGGSGGSGSFPGTGSAVVATSLGSTVATALNAPFLASADGGIPGIASKQLFVPKARTLASAPPQRPTRTTGDYGGTKAYGRTRGAGGAGVPLGQHLSQTDRRLAAERLFSGQQPGGFPGQQQYIKVGGGEPQPISAGGGTRSAPAPGVSSAGSGGGAGAHLLAQQHQYLAQQHLAQQHQHPPQRQQLQHPPQQHQHLAAIHPPQQHQHPPQQHQHPPQQHQHLAAVHPPQQQQHPPQQHQHPPQQHLAAPMNNSTAEQLYLRALEASKISSQHRQSSAERYKHAQYLLATSGSGPHTNHPSHSTRATPHAHHHPHPNNPLVVHAHGHGHSSFLRAQHQVPGGASGEQSRVKFLDGTEVFSQGGGMQRNRSGERGGMQRNRSGERGQRYGGAPPPSGGAMGNGRGDRMQEKLHAKVEERRRMQQAAYAKTQ